MLLAKIPHVISVSASVPPPHVHTKKEIGNYPCNYDYSIDCVIKDESYYNGRTVEELIKYAMGHTRAKKDVLDSIRLALKQEKADPSRNITRVELSLRLNGRQVGLADVVNTNNFEDGEVTVTGKRMRIKRADIYICKYFVM